jgi:hypothetical protein
MTNPSLFVELELQTP